MARRKKNRFHGLGDADDFSSLPHCHVAAGGAVDGWNGRLTEGQCARLKPDTNEWLGKGSFATAYGVDGDPTRVVKFTGDPADAKAARRFLGKQMTGTVNVFDVVKLKNQRGTVSLWDKVSDDFIPKKRQPIYAIVTERVNKVDFAPYREPIRALSQTVAWFRDELVKLKPGKGFALPDYVVEKARDACKDSDCQPKLDVVIAAIEEAAQEGSLILDLHSGNWGMRNGKPVVLDFGVAVDDGKNKRIDLAKVPKRPKTRRMAGRRRVR